MTPSTASPTASTPSGAHAADPTAAAAMGVLRQCAEFIGRLPPATYSAPSAAVAGSTIGQHVRHALDHFAAAAGAIDGAVIAYDHRERDTPIEHDPAAALAKMAALERAMAQVDAAAGAAPVRIRVMLSGAGDEATLASTLARELAFATHHAIHHHAMIATIAREHGAEPPAGFGRAPSTLHHEAPGTQAR